MEVYQWRLNTPGNYQGVVLADDADDAFNTVAKYASVELGEKTNDIDMLWIGYNSAANPDIYMIRDM